MDTELPAVPYLDILVHEHGLTYNEVAHYAGVSPCTVHQVWRQPPGYVAASRLDDLQKMIDALDEASESGEYNPANLPKGRRPAAVTERRRILDTILKKE